MRISAGLPLNANIWDIMGIVEEIKGYTCTIPRTCPDQITKTAYVQTDEKNLLWNQGTCYNNIH